MYHLIKPLSGAIFLSRGAGVDERKTKALLICIKFVF
jgi:hypothetical protein